MRQAEYLVLALLAVALAGVANAEYVVDLKPAGNRPSALLPDTSHDIALIGIIAPGPRVDPSAPFNPQVRLVNLGTGPELGIPVHLTIDSLGSQVYNQTFIISYLANGDSFTVPFPTWLPGSVGDSYQVTTWHSYTPDTNRLNDTLYRTVTVAAAPTVIVTAPNGGETWQATLPQNITWTSANSNTDSIVYSTDDGTSWSYVGKQAPPTTRSYAWTVPVTYGTRNRVRVFAKGVDSIVSDQSDTLFTITPPDTVWMPQPPIPDGPKHKAVKAGGCVASDGSGNLYLLKGNSTCEFYRYDAASGIWYTGDSIPVVDPDGKKRPVKKGASMAVAGGSVFVLKGGRSIEYWRYNPRAVDGTWSPVTTVPIMTSSSQTSDGATYVYMLGYDKNSKTAVFTRTNASSGFVEPLTPPLPHTPGGSKTFKTGSCIVYYPDDKQDGVSRVFALQLSTNDFYSYNTGLGSWTWVNSLPLYWPGTTAKKKVGAGAGMAYAAVNKTIYGLKGGNTLELWSYKDNGSWMSSDPVPALPSNKKVKDGGGITCASGSLYIVKGNKTTDSYSMQLLSWKDQTLMPGAGVQSVGSNTGPAFGLAVAPNPIARDSRVSFSLPRAGNAELKLYDATGKLVSTLASGYHATGNHAYRLSPTTYRLSAGVYLLSLETEGCATTSKLIIE